MSKQGEKRQALKMPGRVYNWFALEANRQREVSADTHLCDAIARPKLKRVGKGFTAYVFLPELDQEDRVDPASQADRLLDWVTDSAPAYVRAYRDWARKLLKGDRP